MAAHVGHQGEPGAGVDANVAANVLAAAQAAHAAQLGIAPGAPLPGTLPSPGSPLPGVGGVGVGVGVVPGAIAPSPPVVAGAIAASPTPTPTPTGDEKWAPASLASDPRRGFDSVFQGDEPARFTFPSGDQGMIATTDSVYEWTIPAFDKLTTDRHSEEFKAGGYVWRMLAQPRIPTGFIAFWIQIRTKIRYPDYPFVAFRFLIVGGANDRESDHTFTPQEDDRGFHNFLALADIPKVVNAAGALRLRILVCPRPRGGHNEAVSLVLGQTGAQRATVHRWDALRLARTAALVAAHTSPPSASSSSSSGDIKAIEGEPGAAAAAAGGGGGAAAPTATPAPATEGAAAATATPSAGAGAGAGAPTVSAGAGAGAAAAPATVAPGAGTVAVVAASSEGKSEGKGGAAGVVEPAPLRWSLASDTWVRQIRVDYLVLANPLPILATVQKAIARVRTPGEELGWGKDLLDELNDSRPSLLESTEQEKLWTIFLNHQLVASTRQLQPILSILAQFLPFRYRIGERITAQDSNGKWLGATITQVRPNAVRVLFDGWSESWSEWVRFADDRLRAPPSTEKKSAGWACPKCTFENAQADTACGVCGERAPIPVAPQDDLSALIRMPVAGGPPTTAAGGEQKFAGVVAAPAPVIHHPAVHHPAVHHPIHVQPPRTVVVHPPARAPWTCAVCTFQNTATHHICGMCDSPAPV